MKIGCCATLRSFVPQVSAAVNQSLPAGADGVYQTLHGMLVHLKESGYDFAEFTVGMVDESVPQDEYDAVKRAIADSGLPVLAYNCFIPAKLKITGPSVDLAALRSYVTTALERVAGTGASIVVLGSGGARRVPQGWSMDAADDQVEAFLRMVSPIAAANGITIAIEHLNKTETNWGNSVNAVVAMARRVSLPAIKVLVDFYHMDVEKEDLTVIEEAGDLVVHAHVADTKRLYPGSGTSDIKGFMGTLQKIGFAGGLSVECVFHDFRTESKKAAEFLSELNRA